MPQRKTLGAITVVLVLADASLANDQVLTNYMLNDVEAPEKILVSNSAGPRPFRLSAGRLRLGGRNMNILHVMADGFPARNLTLDYHVRLTPVLSRPVTMGPPVSPRVAIREQQGEAQLRRERREHPVGAVARAGGRFGAGHPQPAAAGPDGHPGDEGRDEEHHGPCPGAIEHDGVSSLSSFR